MGIADRKVWVLQETGVSTGEVADVREYAGQFTGTHSEPERERGSAAAPPPPQAARLSAVASEAA